MFMDRSLNITKLSILQKLNHWFISIPVKIPGVFFEDTDKMILKLTWKGKGTWTEKEVTGLGEPLLSWAGEENKGQKPTPLLLGAGGQPVLIHWTLWILMTAFLKVGDVHCWRKPRSFCIGPDKCFQLPLNLYIYLVCIDWGPAHK